MGRYTEKSRTEKVQEQQEEVVNGIIAALEKGVAPWSKCWSPSGDVPRNGQSGRPYHGMNVWITMASAFVNGFTDNRWYTFDQAKELCGFKAEWVTKTVRGRTKKVKVWTWAEEGDAPCDAWEAGVKKGEKSTAILWAGIGHREDVDQETGEITEKFWRQWKIWRVFNHCQINWTPGHEPSDGLVEVDPSKGYEAAAELFESLPLDVRHGGDVAAYNPKTDRITLPKPGSFNSLAAYWSTRAHETVHATGNKKRVGRPLDTRFGSEAYAYEELVAEMGAAFMCAELGIEGQLQHESYIGSWIKVLKKETRVLFDAAREARKACDWIRGDEATQAARQTA